MSPTNYAVTLTIVLSISRPAFLSGFLNGVPKRVAKVDLVLTDLGGKRVHLRDYRGQIIVLNFWATWCRPCKEELPLLVETEKAYEGRQILFLGVSVDDSKTQPRVPEFVNTYNITFPVWVGGTADDLSRLGMGEAVPATAFVDREGHVAARVLGEIRKAELTERIEWLLGDRPSPPPKVLVSHLDN